MDEFLTSIWISNLYLDTSSHLYNRVFPYVRRSVGPRVTLSSKTEKSMIGLEGLLFSFNTYLIMVIRQKSGDALNCIGTAV